MRAAVLREGTIVVDDVDDLEPGPGQLLVRTLACGICGSDLHTVAHGDQMEQMVREQAAGADGIPVGAPMDLRHDLVLGHEFCGEVVAVGEGATNHREGDVVVSMPVTFDAEGVHALGFSNRYPGGFAEQLVISDLLALTVPDGLDPQLASLTEPLAVGLHAVRRSKAATGRGAVVVGCGPVGLAVIAALRLTGAEPIVAADYSPARRTLAQHFGAHEVTDPADEPPLERWRSVAPAGPAVIFEAVGVPGVIDDLLRAAPRRSQIVVVGVCMVPDTIHPMRAVTKELDLRFVLAYEPAEFAETLALLADGSIEAAPLVTGTVPLDGVAGAFGALGDPEAHAKILVTPAS